MGVCAVFDTRRLLKAHLQSEPGRHMVSRTLSQGPCRFLIAGGATGGHLFPGLAIAESRQRQAPGSEVRFAGSAYGIEHRAVPARGYRLYRIAVRGLYGVPLRRRLLRLAILAWAFVQCVPILLAYLERWKAEVGACFDGVSAASSDDELLRIAPDHPVFRLGEPTA